MESLIAPVEKSNYFRERLSQSIVNFLLRPRLQWTLFIFKVAAKLHLGLLWSVPVYEVVLLCSHLVAVKFHTLAKQVLGQPFQFI